TSVGGHVWQKWMKERCGPLKAYHGGTPQKLECPGVDWPQEPYLRIHRGGSSQTADEDVVVALSKLIGTRTVAFVGDSVTNQLYMSLFMALYRSNHLLMELADHQLQLSPLLANDTTHAVKRLKALRSGSEVESLTPCCPIITADGGILMFIGSMKYNASKWDQFLAKQPFDVLVVNYGLHYERDVNYQLLMGSLIHKLDSHVTNHSGRLAIVRETTAQHFYTFDLSGDYEKRVKLDFDHKTCACVELGNATVHNTRNCALNEVLDQAMAVQLWPVYRMTANRYNLHCGRKVGKQSKQVGCDCSHWCYIPTFWDVWFVGLRRAIMSAEARLPTSKGLLA
ncbi:hypothetical protein CYMTET_45964, partial [Cymbomonas tetramitiformis]